MTRWQVRGTAALCGLGLAAGSAPFSFPWLVFVAVPVLAWLMGRARSIRDGAAIGWWCGIAYFAASMNWIVAPFFVEPERHAWMSPFALVLLAIGLGLFWAVAFGLATRFDGRARIVAMVIWWTFAEFARAHVLTGFPWGQISYGWSATPIFQHLAYLGPHGLTFATLLVASLPALVGRGLGAGLVVVITAVAWIGGAARMQPVADTDLTVRLVQPNAPQDQKWDPAMVRLFWERGLSLTESGEVPDVVIWPETSVPFLWEEEPNGRARMIRAARGAHLIAGHRRWAEDGLRNALVHVDGSGTQVAAYDKHHLVPFGEYVPLGNLAARFGIHGLAANDGVGFAAGPGPRIIAPPDIPPYLPLICYEAIFPGLAQVGDARPAWLLHLTNDAWFGRFSGPYQHLVQARARAIEQGLPLARAANTGVSAMIDPYGRLAGNIALNTAGALDAALPVAIAPPPYTRTGEAPWLFVACGMFFGMFLRRATKRR